MSKTLDRIALFFAERQYRHDLMRLEENAMTYKLMKRIITKGGYDEEKTKQKLDVFLKITHGVSSNPSRNSSTPGPPMRTS